jgi:hypothetical protein
MWHHEVQVQGQEREPVDRIERGEGQPGVEEDLGQRPLIGGRRSDQPFADLDEACDFYEAYLDVSGPEARGFLRDCLAARLVSEPSGWVAPSSRRAVVLWWPGAVS